MLPLPAREYRYDRFHPMSNALFCLNILTSFVLLMLGFEQAVHYLE